MKLRHAWVLLLLGAWAPGLASAQGGGLSAPTEADAASAWMNPASMSAGEGSYLELMGGVLPVGAQYTTADGRRSETFGIAPLGTLGGYTDALHPDWRIGFSLGLVRASGGTWSRDDPAGDITRWYLVSGTSFHIAATPAVSWSPIPEFSVGLGVNLVYSNAASELDKDFGAQLNQTVMSDDLNSPFPYANADLAAPVTVEGDGVGMGGILGFLVRPIPEVSLAASVHSPVPLTTTGTLNVAYPDRLRAFVDDVLPSAELPEIRGDIFMDFDLPLYLLFGAAFRPHEMVQITTQYRYENQASQPNFYVRVDEATRTSDSLTDNVKPQAFVDRHQVFLRVSVFPIPELRIAALSMFQTNSAPEATTAPNTLDFNRLELGLAARWRIAPEFSVMAQYSHTFLFDTNVDESLFRPVAQPSLTAFNRPTPTGVYSGAANSVRLGVALHL
ncbi:MAG: OmpP1/FadL family transporter [Sandaracinaceae bacterium]